MALRQAWQSTALKISYEHVKTGDNTNDNCLQPCGHDQPLLQWKSLYLMILPAEVRAEEAFFIDWGRENIIVKL